MVKSALLSDIHSNIFALEAVVQDARAKGVEEFVNLGDILYGPIAPKATFDYLQKLGAITISGNQDRQIYQATTEEIESNPTMQFILGELGDAPLDWMRRLPFDRHITPDVYACHGTPENDLIYLLEDIRSGKPDIRNDAEIVRLLNGVAAPIILCGHTHIPRCIELSTGQMVINPGSVGLQAYTDEEPNIHSMENYTPRASYAILEKNNVGQWNVGFHRVTYDVESAIKAASIRQRGDWVHFLKTGRSMPL